MEIDNNKQLDELFNQAKSETPEVSFEETKAQFLTSLSQVTPPSSQVGTSYLFTAKTWIIMITTIVTTIGFTTLFLLVNSTPLAEQNTRNNEQIISLSTKSVNVKLPVEMEENLNPLPIIENPEKAILIAVNGEIDLKNDENEIVTNEPILVLYSDTSVPDELYRFPILTEEEIKANHKQKAKMVKQLMKYEKGKDYGKYVSIPKGSLEYQKRTVSVSPFFMQGSEVNNLEYRTFLFDLLIQNKKEAFLRAKPDQSQWSKLEERSAAMEEMYFSHPSYNEYPVNNISREGAEMYCAWLAELTNQQLSNKGKSSIEVRIPSNIEWTYAALGGHVNPSFPWGGSSYRNSEGCYLANFSPNEGVDADGGTHLVEAYSYAPNAYGLWCMSGNVAEMVYYENDRSKPGARGGSWNSSSEEIKIDGSDPYKGVISPNVNIGFRVVVTNGTPKTK